jgi:hypothetical protein
VWFGTTSAPSFPAGSFIATSTGAVLTTGGVWTNSSDRNLKTNFQPVDGRQLLAKLNAMPMTTWNYKAEDPSMTHLGPMAQDFCAAFHLGPDDKHITTVDEGGVALAAIQELYRLSLRKDEQIRAQADEIRALTRQVAELRNVQQQVAALEARLAQVEVRHGIVRSRAARHAVNKRKAEVRRLLAKVTF